MTNRLAGKVAIITGTGGSMGRAASLLFAREGAAIVGCDTNRAEGERTVELVRAAGGRMAADNDCDLTDPAKSDALVNLAMREFGRLDIVFNIAGRAAFAPIEDMTPEKFRRGIEGELDIVLYLCRAAWPKLIAGGGGSIISIASKSGRRGNPQLGNTAHAAAKGAIIAMMRQLAVDGAPHGVRANAISPGVIRSNATARLLADDKWRKDAIARTLIKRIGEPEDVAHCALYLASDESGWVTGANIPVDGGASAW